MGMIPAHTLLRSFSLSISYTRVRLLSIYIEMGTVNACLPIDSRPDQHLDALRLQRRYAS